MNQTFTVTAVQPNPRDWNATVGGAMKAYRVSLKDDAGNETTNVEWSRKATSPPPEIGEQAEGTLDTTGPYGPKFKKALGAGGGGGGARGGRSPEESARIIQQHSQEMALRYAELQHTCGKLPENFNLEQVLIIAGKFAADAMAAKP